MTSFLVLHLEREREERPPPLCCSKILAEDMKSNKQCQAWEYLGSVHKAKLMLQFGIFPLSDESGRGISEILSILT